MRARTVLFLIPVLVFWLLAMEGVRRGMEGAWHDECARLWQAGRWHELQSLADNLWNIGDRDSESLFYAVAACGPVQEHARASLHAARYIQTRALNWKRETCIRQFYQPSDPRRLLALHRAGLAYALLALIALLNAACFLARRNPLPWTCFFSVAGCIILLL